MFRTPGPRSSSLRRRTLVVAAPAAVVALAACDPLGDPVDDDTPAGRAPEDPDRAALDDTLTDTLDAAALVDATVAAYPALATRFAGLSGLHETHRAALEGAGGDEATPATTATPPVVATPAPQAVAALRRAERGLAARLASRAQRAESGTFARLLAVMSAAVQQELAALDGASR